MIIGVSGDVGSFSEEAALVYIKKSAIRQYQLQYLINMENVLAALSNKTIELGIFPVVNNNSGLVRPAFDAMGRYLFEIIDDVHLDVWQCLLAKKLLTQKQIKAIYSYPPAFDQCKKFLADEVMGIPTIDWGDTAKAARDLSNGVINDNCVVIGSKAAAEAYNLHILATNIQDVKPNITIFVVLRSLC